MTSNPSATPWADQPYELLSTARLQKGKNAHGAHRTAMEMAHAHNCLIRGLNSIILQAPCIPDATQSQSYIAQDVIDLMLYTEAWAKGMEHHHHVEETTLFPHLQKVKGMPADTFESPLHQHETIHDGLIKLLNYASSTSTQPADYRWKTMKEIIDSFAEELKNHLHDEIEVLLGLESYDSTEVWKCFEATEKAAQADANLELLQSVFPCVLGASDRTYEGGNTWPELPWFMFYLIKYWFARKRTGSWRFCPCDFFGRPRPLQMLSKEFKSGA